MEQLEIEPIVRTHAATRGVVVWEAMPWGGATVLWPDSEGLDGFLAVFDQLECSVLYLQDDADAVGFAAQGVVHVFASAALRLKLDPAYEADDDDGGDFDLVPTVRSQQNWQDPYYDWESQRLLEGDLRALVDEIVADSEFDGHRSRSIRSERLLELTPEDEECVANVARKVFNETVGKDLDAKARRLAPGLAKHSDFDPLAYGDELSDFVSRHLPGEDSRLISRVSGELRSHAEDSGLAAKARRESKIAARSILNALPAELRDRFGFTSRNNLRLQLLSEHLADVPEHRRSTVVYDVASLEEELFQAEREARYATAVRQLMAKGFNKSATSRRLGVSTSIMDRITATNRTDVNFAPDDPIITTLAPELA